jgi:hypothetical protein
MLVSRALPRLSSFSTTAVSHTNVNKILTNILDDAAQIARPPPPKRISQQRSCICPSAFILCSSFPPEWQAFEIGRVGYTF